MYTKGKSLAEHIDQLARRTGAPSSYVDKVRALFVRKGISLDAASEPYENALEEAFTRQESIRKSVTQAVQNLVLIQQQLGILEKTRTQYITKLRDIRDSLVRQGHETRTSTRRTTSVAALPAESRDAEATKTPLIRGDHDFALVPGPADEQ